MSWSFGEEYVVSSISSSKFCGLCRLDNTHILTCYTLTSNNYPYARVAEISDGIDGIHNVYTLGTEINVSNRIYKYGDVCALDSTHVISAYVRYTTATYNGLYARIGTVSGTSLSFGSELMILSATDTNYIPNTVSVKKISSTKFAIAWDEYFTDTQQYQHNITIADANGTTIENATTSHYKAVSLDNSYGYPAVCYLNSSSYVGVVYQDPDSSGKVVICHVESDNTITLGSPCQFCSNAYEPIAKIIDSTHILILYSNDSYLTSCIGTISGTSVSTGTEYVSSYITQSDNSMYVYDSENFAAVFRNNYSDGYIVLGNIIGSTISYGEAYRWQGDDNVNFQTIVKAYDKCFSIVFIDYADNYIKVIGARESTLDAIKYIGSGEATFSGESNTKAHYDYSNYIGSGEAELNGESEYLYGILKYKYSGSGFAYLIPSTIYYKVPNKFIVRSQSTFGNTPSPVNFNKMYHCWFDETTISIVFKDSNGRGKSVIGTISETSMSWGTEYVFNESNTEIGECFAIDAAHFGITYKDINGQGKIIIAIVSNKEISYGAASAFYNGVTNIKSILLDNNKIVISWNDTIDYCGRACIGIISGTSINWGTSLIYHQGYSLNYSLSKINNTQFLIIYNHNSIGKSIIGTISGSTFLTWGQKYAFSNLSTLYLSSAILSPNKCITAYYLSGECYIKIGTISGTVVNWGDAYSFESDIGQYLSLIALNENNFIVAYYASGNGKIIQGIIKESDILFANNSSFEYGIIDYIDSQLLNDGCFSIIYCNKLNNKIVVESNNYLL